MKDYPFRFSLDETPSLRTRLSRDLNSITEAIVEEIPDAMVVLAGSLAYGEGIVKKNEGKEQFLSDYDIYVVVPSLRGTLRFANHERTRCLLNKCTPMANVDLNIVWKPLLTLKLTNIEGRVISKQRQYEQIIWPPSPPPVTNNLKRAYGALIKSVVNPQDRTEMQCQAAIYSVWAYLISQGVRGWGNIFSLSRCLELFEQHESHLGEKTISCIRDKIKLKLNPESNGEVTSFSGFYTIRKLLSGLVSNNGIRQRLVDNARYLLAQLKRGKIPNPFIDFNNTFISSAKLLCSAVIDQDTFDLEKIKTSEQLIWKMTLERNNHVNTRRRFNWCADRIGDLDRLYVHKIMIEKTGT